MQTNLVYFSVSKPSTVATYISHAIAHCGMPCQYDELCSSLCALCCLVLFASLCAINTSKQPKSVTEYSPQLILDKNLNFNFSKLFSFQNLCLHLERRSWLRCQVMRDCFMEFIKRNTGFFQLSFTMTLLPHSQVCEYAMFIVKQIKLVDRSIDQSIGQIEILIQ